MKKRIMGFTCVLCDSFAFMPVMAVLKSSVVLSFSVKSYIYFVCVELGSYSIINITFYLGLDSKIFFT